MGMTLRDVAERFAKGADHGKASNLYIEGDVIYSYGPHYPLAIRKDDWGSGVKAIVNADLYFGTRSGRNSPSTNRHRDLVMRALTPNIQIPYSALMASGVLTGGNGWRRPGNNLDLRVVSYRADRWWEECRTCHREVKYEYSAAGMYIHTGDGSPICPRKDGDPDKGNYFQHHQLGAVVFEHKGNHFLSSLDEGRYFLCQLPWWVETVDEAFYTLTPQAVRDAQASGLEVLRQGDVFLIPTERKTKELPGPSAKFERLFGGSHVPTETRRNGNVYVRGVMRHNPPDRRAEHRRVRLGDRWHIAIRNNAVASWGASGAVD